MQTENKPDKVTECRYCGERIRPTEVGDGVDPEDLKLFPWVDKVGNPICAGTLTHEPAPLNLVEVMTRDVPEGAQVSAVRQDTLPARKWVDTGIDGMQIFLDVGQEVRYLLRTVKATDQADRRPSTT